MPNTPETGVMPTYTFAGSMYNRSVTEDHAEHSPTSNCATYNSSRNASFQYQSSPLTSSSGDTVIAPTDLATNYHDRACIDAPSDQGKLPVVDIAMPGEAFNLIRAKLAMQREHIAELDRKMVRWMGDVSDKVVRDTVFAALRDDIGVVAEKMSDAAQIIEQVWFRSVSISSAPDDDTQPFDHRQTSRTVPSEQEVQDMGFAERVSVKLHDCLSPDKQRLRTHRGSDQSDDLLSDYRSGLREKENRAASRVPTWPLASQHQDNSNRRVYSAPPIPEPHKLEETRTQRLSPSPAAQQPSSQQQDIEDDMEECRRAFGEHFTDHLEETLRAKLSDTLKDELRDELCTVVNEAVKPLVESRADLDTWKAALKDELQDWKAEQEGMVRVFRTHNMDGCSGRTYGSVKESRNDGEESAEKLDGGRLSADVMHCIRTEIKAELTGEIKEEVLKKVKADLEDVEGRLNFMCGSGTFKLNFGCG